MDVGPFRALLDPATDLIWLNYAVPVAPLGNLDEAAAALRELERMFTAYRRTENRHVVGVDGRELKGLLAGERYVDDIPVELEDQLPQRGDHHCIVDDQQPHVARFVPSGRGASDQLKLPD